ncbi:hypothetical protein NXW78_28350 [Bacteroides ovatus]|nr:hypothetical protein [Bacteroides ovatus]
MKYYTVKNRIMPWGSYGEMLWQGIYCYDKDTNSHMIFRTGAFCPSIYRSQYNRESPVLIVKEDVLQYIIESNLTGFVLQPVNKEKIVKLDWGELGFTITGAFDISVWKYGCGRIYYTAQT